MRTPQSLFFDFALNEELEIGVPGGAAIVMPACREGLPGWVFFPSRPPHRCRISFLFRDLDSDVQSLALPYNDEGPSRLPSATVPGDSYDSTTLASSVSSPSPPCKWTGPVLAHGPYRIGPVWIFSIHLCKWT